MQQIYNHIWNNSHRKGPENWMNRESTTKGGKYSIKMGGRGRETVLPRKIQQSNQWATTEWNHKGLDLLYPNQQRMQAPHQESQPIILYGKDQPPQAPEPELSLSVCLLQRHGLAVACHGDGVPAAADLGHAALFNIEPQSRRPTNCRTSILKKSHTVNKALGPTTDFPIWGSSKGTENPQEIWLRAPVGFDCRTFAGLGKQTFGEHKQNLACTRNQEKGAVFPQETESDLPVSVQESLVEACIDSLASRQTTGK